MGEYFVHSEQMTVGYDGKPLIRDSIEPGRNPYSDRTERCRKINNIEESYQTAKAGRRDCVSGSETDESDVRQGSRTEAGRCNDGENKTRAYDM